MGEFKRILHIFGKFGGMLHFLLCILHVKYKQPPHARGSGWHAPIGYCFLARSVSRLSMMVMTRPLMLFSVVR